MAFSGKFALTSFLPSPRWGEGAEHQRCEAGEGESTSQTCTVGTPSPARGACHRAGHFEPDPLARDLSPHPKSDVSDFGHLILPNSGTPEFGGER